MPDPAPLSGNCDVVRIWSGTGGVTTANTSSTQTAPAAPVSNSMDVSFNMTAPVEEKKEEAPAEVKEEANSDVVLSIPTVPEVKEEEKKEENNNVGSNVPEVPEEKFDDSFIIGAPTTEAAPEAKKETKEETTEEKPNLVDFTMNNPMDANSMDNNMISPDSTTGISEIAEVNISSNGMLEEQHPEPAATEGPELTLDDDDDDDGVDFE